MLHQEDISEYIQQAMPELSGIVEAEKSPSVYNIVQHMLKYTKSQVIRHNMDAAKKCMALAEQLYYKGNNAIKNAIENVFIFSFSHAFFHDEDKRKEMMKLVPDSLYKLYRKQLLNNHL